jgi:IS30 family transposase
MKEAEQAYTARREACCRKKLYENPKLCAYIAEKLTLAWSPEQIAGRMRRKKMSMCVSFSSIYRWLNENLLPRAVQLKENLRFYRRKTAPPKRVDRVDARSIRTRAEHVLRRHRYGNWEVDTIVFGAFPNQRYLLNVNERKSKYCALMLLQNIKKEEMMRAFTMTFSDRRLPLKTMTSDRGMEFKCHNEFENLFSKPYYYTDRGKPYQKPTVENTNGLIRQYLPKGTQISELPPDRIPDIMAALNNRPRKSLGFRTPAEALHLT